MGDEIGASVGSTKKASGFIVGSCSLFGGLESAEPHPYLLRCVFNLSHPSPRRPLSHPDKLVCVAAASVSSTSLELAFFACWNACPFHMLLLLLELNLHCTRKQLLVTEDFRFEGGRQERRGKCYFSSQREWRARLQYCSCLGVYGDLYMNFVSAVGVIRINSDMAGFFFFEGTWQVFVFTCLRSYDRIINNVYKISVN